MSKPLSKPIEEFLKTYTSKSTRSAYNAGINNFLSFIYGKIDPEQYETQAIVYLTDTKRNHKEDVRDYARSLSSSAPLTWGLYTTALKMFLKKHGIEFDNDFWKELKRLRNGTKARTIDYVPTNKELAKIIGLMPLHGKALFTLLATTGMRIGEALKLRPQDIKLDIEDHPDIIMIRINGQYTKSGNSRIALATSEAKEFLIDWLKQRDQYVKTTKSKGKRLKSIDTDKPYPVFPFSYANVNSMLAIATRRAGLLEHDNSTGRRTIHIHSMRKFFRSKFGVAGNPDVAEVLMGHEGYLTNEYRKPSTEELINGYEKGMHALSIFSNGAAMKKVESKLEEQEKLLTDSLKAFNQDRIELERQKQQIKMLWDMLEGQQETNKKLQKTIADLERRITDEVRYRSQLENILSDVPTLKKRIDKLETCDD